MGQGASPPPVQWPQPLRSHPLALQRPSQGCGPAPQPAYRYSDAFARALLAVLQLPHVLAAFRPAAAADGKRAVVERVQLLRHAHAPLAREAKKLLEKLQ